MEKKHIDFSSWAAVTISILASMIWDYGLVSGAGI